MKGAIAAGHPLTAEAGARVLEAGGNAVDACVAAAFVSWGCESPLTGAGGGGFMLVHDAPDGRTRLLDFFVTVAAAPAPGGELARRIVEHVQSGGGALTLEDLAGYRVVRRRPLVVSYREHEFRSNPPPSSGGLLIGVGLRALGDAAPTPTAIAAAMEAQDAARSGTFVRALHHGGLAKKLLSGTTHISVVDSQGSAASLSASLGSGSGVVVPGTGIHLNNMLGEADLVAGARPGERLTSMMAPSIVFHEGTPRLVIGSAGSARLRGAILQVIANVLAGGMGIEEAVDAPRIHVESDVVHCEDPAVAADLEAAG